MNITAVIIAKNEENMIADCIDSVNFADEIILINNNSIDRTAEIAEKMGAKIIDANTNDFSKLRNIGIEKSKGKWIFYIDSDERVSEELKKSIIEKTKNEENFTAYKINRQNFYLGKTKWPKIENMERLFLREKLKSWKGKLHESAIFEGEVGKLNGYLLHFTHRNLSQMLDKTIKWSDTEASLRFETKHPKMTWWRFPRVMITSFFDSYVKQKGYKMGASGLIESIFQAYSSFITYAKLWELQNQNNNSST